MGFWVFMYKKPSDHPKVNAAELEYIEQDQHEVVDGETVGKEQEGEKISFWRTLSFKQTWAFAFGKFMTDGVWWFFLFWTPSYLNSQFGIKMSEGLGVALIFTLYAITMLSIYGGKLPTIIINKDGAEPLCGTHARHADLRGSFRCWCCWRSHGHDLAVVPDHPDRSGRRGAPVVVGQYLLDHRRHVPQVGDRHRDGHRRPGRRRRLDDPQWFAGWLFVYADETAMQFMGFEGKPAGYFVVFCICAVAYLIGLDRDEDAGSEIQTDCIGLT